MIEGIDRLDGGDDVDVDPELHSALRVLEPTSRDANYWFRFRSWVMTEAGPELARRRFMARLTIGDVMASWARMVVPTAALAAGFAAALLLRSGAGSEPLPFGVEELLVSEIEESPGPVETPAELIGPVSFAAEVF